MVCILLEALPTSYVGSYLVFSVLAVLTVIPLSGAVFVWLYSGANFSKWQKKSNGEYPRPSYVREELIKTVFGCFYATIFPALGVYLRSTHWDNQAMQFVDSKSHPATFEKSKLKVQGYCGLEETSYLDMLFQFVLIVCFTDLFEYLYHALGHKWEVLWSVHRHHHKFYNPTPFAVIADEAMDNIIRAMPLLILQFLRPINLDILYYTFTVFFYSYGVYLHSGYEIDDYVPSDHWLINTSFQHYIHHAAGTRSRAYHCGFFIKLWDNAFGTVYDGKPCHAAAQRAEGKRSRELWDKQCAKFPNYDLLFSWNFWRNPKKFADYEYIDVSTVKWRMM